jgi:hypothetical protein
MRLIAPHFRRAFLIGKAIDLHKVEAAAFAETISGLATAVFLLNAGGGLVHANPSAEAMLLAEDPVRVSRGLLIAFDERAHKALPSRPCSCARRPSTLALRLRRRPSSTASRRRKSACSAA